MELLPDLEIEKIKKNPHQPRKTFSEEELQELSQSIQELGLIHPPTVRRLSSDSFELISGERRLQASQLAGLSKIPVYVKEASSSQSAFSALAENLQRVDLNPLEVANSLYIVMKDSKLSQEEIAEKLGKKRSTVANFLRLLHLPPLIQKELSLKKITMGHAKAILGLATVEERLALCQKVIEKSLSVRQTETLAQKKAPTAKKTSSPKSSLLPVRQLEKKLSFHLKRQVQIQSNCLSIPFFSGEDLLALVAELIADC